MSTPIPVRFVDKPLKMPPAGADIVPGTDMSSGDDAHFTLDGIAQTVAAILADRLLSVDDRAKINAPATVVRVQSRYFRGTTAPSVDVNNANPGPGWVTDPGTGTAAVWRIDSNLNDGVFVPPWSVAIKISGEQGIPGLPGDAGDDGVPLNGNTYYFQDTFPTGPLVVNDIVWKPGENYKQYRWTGSAWVASFTPFLNTDSAGRVTGLVRAGDGSDKAFVLIADRFQIWDGASAQAPFEVIGGVVYIKDLVVRQVAAAKIIGGNITGQEFVLFGTGARIRSNDFVSGVSGWQIDAITGAEFPSLIVRSGMIEANAATRRYGVNLAGVAPFAASTWADIATIAVLVESGNSAIINVAFQHIQNGSAPFAHDMTMRLLRSDSSQVGQIGQTVTAGASTLISYCFFDETPTTSYTLQLNSGGGPGGAALPSMSVIVFRK